MKSISKSTFFLIFITAIWFGKSYWAHLHYLPYDVNNTDVGTYLFQAQTFAHGQIVRQTPEPREFFQQWQAVVRDHSYAYYPPIHALFLALPIRMGMDPWLICWLLSGASLGGMFLVGRKMDGEKMGVIACALLSLSPFFSANAPSLLSHSSTLLLTVVFLGFTLDWLKTGGKSHAWISGIGLGLIFADRPANAAALGLVWIPWIAWQRRKQIRSETLSWLSFGTGGLCIFLPLIVYYHSLSGKWSLDLFKDYWPRNRFGFGKDLGRGEPGHFFQTYTDHNWTGYFKNLQYSFSGLTEWWSGNTWLSLLILAGVLFFAIRVFRKSRENGAPRVESVAPKTTCLRQGFDLVSANDLADNPQVPSPLPYLPFALWALIHILIYAFYFTQSTPPSGPRYLTEILPALALLSAWVFICLFRRPSLRWISILLGVGFLLTSNSRIYSFYQKNALGIPARRQVEECVFQKADQPALIFLRSFWLGHPFPIFLNSPDFQLPILFACDRGEEDKKLVSRYPDRNAYILSVSPTNSRDVRTELIPIYQAHSQTWLLDPSEVESPFFIGSRFTPPLKLKGENFRKLFHPRPEDIIPQ